MDYYDQILFEAYKKCKVKYKVNKFLAVTLGTFSIVIVFLILISFNIVNKITVYGGILSFIVFIIVFRVSFNLFKKKRGIIEYKELKRNRKKIKKFRRELYKSGLSTSSVQELSNIVRTRVESEYKHREKVSNITITIFILTAITVIVQVSLEILKLQVTKSDQIVELKIKKYNKIGKDEYNEIKQMIESNFSSNMEAYLIFGIKMVFIIIFCLYLYRLIVYSYGGSRLFKTYNEKLLDILNATNIYNK